MADPFSMVVAIVAIGCASGIVGKALEVAAMKKRDTSAQLKAELAAMRQEMAALKTWASDLVLSFDSTLHQQAARIQSLERRALGEGSTTARVGAGASEARSATETVEIRPHV